VLLGPLDGVAYHPPTKFAAQKPSIRTCTEQFVPGAELPGPWVIGSYPNHRWRVVGRVVYDERLPHQAQKARPLLIRHLDSNARIEKFDYQPVRHRGKVRRLVL
jgi:hypothetical protein